MYLPNNIQNIQTWKSDDHNENFGDNIVVSHVSF